MFAYAMRSGGELKKFSRRALTNHPIIKFAPLQRHTALGKLGREQARQGRRHLRRWLLLRSRGERARPNCAVYYERVCCNQKALRRLGVEFTKGKRPGVRLPTEADAFIPRCRVRLVCRYAPSLIEG